MPDLTRPGFWMHETSGVLRPAIQAYLLGQPMTAGDIAAMRAYLRQWIAWPAWQGPQIDTLRRSVDGLGSRAAIDHWLNLAEAAGIDPL